MKTSLSQRILLGTLAVFGLCGAALAHGDVGDGPTEDSSWGLGLAVMSESKPYRDFDNMNRPGFWGGSKL